MDVTLLFKACVKTVRTTNKALGIQEPHSQNGLNRTRRDVNLVKAKEVVKQISHLQSLLIENKAAYLNVINYLSTNKTMTEVDREQIDSAAQSIIDSCKKLINEYRHEIASAKKSKQEEEHYYNILDSLEAYLKKVSKIYTEAKAVRVKRVIEAHKLSKLDTIKPAKVSQPEKISRKSSLNHSNENIQLQDEIRLPPLPPIENIDEELSAEEMQMFESENELLFNELNSLSDEVKQMESKVVHIAQLQEVFTEKVLQQEKDIDRILTTTTNTTESIRDANEQIRQALQRNAGLRVWFLFFFLVMSFSLLFLDWYND